MTTINHELKAKCPPERLWQLLSDLESVALYNPTVRSAKLRGTLREGVDAERICQLQPRGHVVERVTHWEDGCALGLEVKESDWPIHFMRWVTRLEPDPEGTRLTQVLEYQVRFGPLGWLLDRLVMQRKLTSTLDGVLKTLVQQAEASQVPPRTSAPISPSLA